MRIKSCVNDQKGKFSPEPLRDGDWVLFCSRLGHTVYCSSAQHRLILQYQTETDKTHCSFREKSSLVPRACMQFHIAAQFCTWPTSDHRENTGPRLPCTGVEWAPRAHMKLSWRRQPEDSPAVLSPEKAGIMTLPFACLQLSCHHGSALLLQVKLIRSVAKAFKEMWVARILERLFLWGLGLDWLCWGRTPECSSWLRGTRVAYECSPDAYSSKAQSDDTHRGGEHA